MDSNCGLKTNKFKRRMQSAERTKRSGENYSALYSCDDRFLGRTRPGDYLLSVRVCIRVCVDAQTKNDINLFVVVVVDSQLISHCFYLGSILCFVARKHRNATVFAWGPSNRRRHFTSNNLNLPILFTKLTVGSHSAQISPLNFSL